MDTFDLKPGHANGGPFKEIETSVPGLKISEHLPKLAAQAENLAIIRSLSTAEGRPQPRHLPDAHRPQARAGRSAFPRWARRFPRPSARDDAELPNFVSIAPYTALNSAAFGPGFLGPRHAPLTVGATGPGEVQPRPGAGVRQRWASMTCRTPSVSRRAGRRPARPVAHAADELSGDARLGLAEGPEHGLRAGRADDAQRSRPGVRPDRRERQGPRRLRPRPVRPGLPAGPPADRAGRAVHRGRPPRRRRRRSAGTRTSRTSTASRRCRASSTPAGRR